MTRYSI